MEHGSHFGRLGGQQNLAFIIIKQHMTAHDMVTLWQALFLHVGILLDLDGS